MGVKDPFSTHDNFNSASNNSESKLATEDRMSNQEESIDMIGFGRASNDFQKLMNKKTSGIFSEDSMSRAPDEDYMRQESSASTNLDLEVLSVHLL